MARVMMEDNVPLSYYAPYLMHAGQVPSRVMSQPSGTFYQHSVAPQPVFVEGSGPYEHPHFLQQSSKGRPIYRVIPKQDESGPLYGTAPIDRDKIALREAFRQALSQEELARASRGQQLHRFAPGFVNAPAAYPAYIVPAASLPQQSSSYQVNHGNEYPVWGLRTPVEEPQVVSPQESLKTSTFQPIFGISDNQQSQPILTPHSFYYGRGMPSSTSAQTSLQGEEVPTLVASDSVLPPQSAAPPRFGWNVFPVDSPVSHFSKAAAPLNVSEESTPMQKRKKTAEVTGEDKVAASKLHDQLIDYLSILFPQATKERLQKAAEEALSPPMGSSKASPADPMKQESKKQECSPLTSSHQRVIKVIPVLDAAAKKEQKEVPVQRTASKEVDRSGDEAQKEIEKISIKKEENTSMDSETAAKKIQAVYRGYIVRRTQPLKHLRDIARVRPKLREMQSQLTNQEDLEKRCRDPVERLKVTECIMGLLLQLDSIQGVDPVVRDIRKSTAREVLRLQDLVDSTIVRLSDSGQPRSENPSDKGDEVAQSTWEDQNRKVDEENVENIASTTSEVVETAEQQSVTTEEKPVAEAEAEDAKIEEKIDVVLIRTPLKPEQVLMQKLLEELKPEERVPEALTKGVKPSFTSKGTTFVRARLVKEILKQLSSENEKPMAEEASADITEDILLSHVGSSANIAGYEPAQPSTPESASAIKSDEAPLYDQGERSSFCSMVHEDQARETSAACLEDAVSKEAKFAFEALDGAMNVVTSESVSKAGDGLGVGTGVEVRDDDGVNDEDKVASKPILGEEESITNRDVAVDTCDDKPHAEQQLELPGEDLLQQESVSSSLVDAYAEQPLKVERPSSFNEEIRHEGNFAVKPLNVEMPLVEQPGGGVASLQHVSDQLRGEHFPEVDLAESRGTGEASSNKNLRSMNVSSEFVLENPPENIDVSSPKKFTEKMWIPAPPTLSTETLQEVGGSLGTSSSLKEMCDSLLVLEALSQKVTRV